MLCLEFNCGCGISEMPPNQSLAQQGLPTACILFCKVKGVKGEEKKDLLLMLCIFIIVKHLPINPILKELLIIIIREFLPEII